MEGINKPASNTEKASNPLESLKNSQMQETNAAIKQLYTEANITQIRCDYEKMRKETKELTDEREQQLNAQEAEEIKKQLDKFTEDALSTFGDNPAAIQNAYAFLLTGSEDILSEEDIAGYKELYKTRALEAIKSLIDNGADEYQVLQKCFEYDISGKLLSPHENDWQWINDLEEQLKN